MISDVLVVILECIGTVAFAVSGTLVAISHKLDLFGVLTVGSVTAVGGGIIRDLLLGNTPPQIFSNLLIILLALLTALAVFIVAFINSKRFKLLSERIDKINIFFDAVGLAVFSVTGVEIACNAGYSQNAVLVLTLGLITGVGGGVLRDIFVNEKPYILTKHIYAVASLTGCAIYYFINVYLRTKVIAAVVATAVIVIIRMLAAHYHWKLPKISVDDNMEKNIYNVGIGAYKRKNKTFYVNGGKLCFTDTAVVLKAFFITVAVFDIEKLKVTRLPSIDIMQYKAVELSDEKNCYECLLNKKGIDKLSRMGWI